MPQSEITLQKITVNVPEDVLADALAVTGEGITQTVREGLERIARSRVYKSLGRMHGSSNIDLDIEALREDRTL
jgi:hypothetical protein